MLNLESVADQFSIGENDYAGLNNPSVHRAVGRTDFGGSDWGNFVNSCLKNDSGPQGPSSWLLTCCVARLALFSILHVLPN
jgi:hypothetical protein